MRSLIGVAGQEQGVSDQAGRGHCQIINLHIYTVYLCGRSSSFLIYVLLHKNMF